MARATSLLLIAALGLAVVHFQKSAFVPPALRRAAPAAIPTAALLGAAAPALADEIGDAAVKLSEASYPFLKNINWNSAIFTFKPGNAGSAADWTKACGTAIDMGASMDSSLVKAAVLAHHNALGPVMRSGGLISKPDYTDVNAAIGRMIASAPEEKVMAVYDSFKKIVDPKVGPYLMKAYAKEADAKAAYAALMDFKDVVKAHPITPAPALASAVKGEKIATAAQTLSDKAYPFLKSIDWGSDIYINPGATGALQILKAVDKALVMGAAIDGASLKEAALAHVKAISSMDKKGVTTKEDFAAINAGIGKMIASVPTSTVMDVYNTMGGITNPDVPKYLLSKVKAVDAKAAYSALMEFKDVVKAVQV